MVQVQVQTKDQIQVQTQVQIQVSDPDLDDLAQVRSSKVSSGLGMDPSTGLLSFRYIFYAFRSGHARLRYC